MIRHTMYTIHDMAWHDTTVLHSTPLHSTPLHSTPLLVAPLRQKGPKRLPRLTTFFVRQLSYPILEGHEVEKPHHLSWVRMPCVRLGSHSPLPKTLHTYMHPCMHEYQEQFQWYIVIAHDTTNQYSTRQYNTTASIKPSHNYHVKMNMI